MKTKVWKTRWSGRTVKARRSLRVASDWWTIRSWSHTPASTSSTARRRSESPAATATRREQGGTSHLSATGSRATQSPWAATCLWWARWGRRARTPLRRTATATDGAGTTPSTWAPCFSWTEATNWRRKPTSCQSWRRTRARPSLVCLHFKNDCDADRDDTKPCTVPKVGAFLKDFIWVFYYSSSWWCRNVEISMEITLVAEQALLIF